MRELPAETIARFWSKVDVRSKDECWPWKDCIYSHSYGCFWLSHTRRVRAHRFAYELTNGPIERGKALDHLCHNRDEMCKGGPTCPHRRYANPSHIEVATGRENTLRGQGPTAQNSRKTHCKNGHPFTRENTLPRQGQGTVHGRDCRICKRARNKRSELKLRGSHENVSRLQTS